MFRYNQCITSSFYPSQTRLAHAEEAAAASAADLEVSHATSERLRAQLDAAMDLLSSASAGKLLVYRLHANNVYICVSLWLLPHWRWVSY